MAIRTRLPIPDPQRGCCVGHPCDDCRTCRAGRCCRTDNPDYQLPRLGDWDGPIYGAIGVVSRPDGDLVECHACGERFAAVLQHAIRAHGLTSEEYRAIFGLFRSDRLAGLAFGRRAAEHARRLQAAGVVQQPAPISGERARDISLRSRQRLTALGRTPAPPARRMADDEEYKRRWHERAGVRYFTPEERAEIRRLRRDLSASALARRYGATRGQIDWVCRELPEPPTLGLPAAQREAIRERNQRIRSLRGTVSARDLAAEYHLTPTTIRAIWREGERS